jgi:hypothetical protein
MLHAPKTDTVAMCGLPSSSFFPGSRHLPAERMRAPGENVSCPGCRAAITDETPVTATVDLSDEEIEWIAKESGLARHADESWWRHELPHIARLLAIYEASVRPQK